MTIEVISPPDPTKPPILASLLKTHLNILSSETEYDTALDLYMSSAVLEFTAITGTALITQTVKQTFDGFPSCEDYFLLERGPYRELVSFTYVDSEGDTQTVDPDSYTILKTGDCPKVCLNHNYSWPSSLNLNFGAVQITYKVGFGADETSVPKDIKHILAMLVGDSFVNRENETVMPGIGAIIVTNSSYRLMKKHKINYYEVKGQKRC